MAWVLFEYESLPSDNVTRHNFSTYEEGLKYISEWVTGNSQNSLSPLQYRENA